MTIRQSVTPVYSNVGVFDSKQRRVFCHAQRMGGINSVIISKDQSCIVSVGQEKKITFWPIGSPEPLFSHNLEGESEEGRCIAR